MSTLTKQGLESLLKSVGVERPLPNRVGVDVLSDLFNVYSSYLADFLVRETGSEADVALRCLQWPSEFGDIVAVLPRLRLPDRDPKQLASDLAAKVGSHPVEDGAECLMAVIQSPLSQLFAQPFDDGIHLRFMFSEQALWRVLIPFILDRGSAYGLPLISREEEETRAPKRLLIEFSSPNVGKEFDGNHLRSTIVGAYLARLHVGMGLEVSRMTFLGDWGKHIGVLAAGWSRFGCDERLAETPLRHMLELTERIDAMKLSQDATEAAEGPGSVARTDVDLEKDTFFKALEDGDLDALSLWQKFRDASLKAYKEMYERLNVAFDLYSGESEVGVDSIAEVEQALEAAEVYESSEGAWVVDFAKHGKPGLGVGIARYQNGTTSYLLRDVAAVLDRKKQHCFDKLIYVVSEKQSTHFRQVIACLNLMGRSELAGSLQHVNFGPVKGAPTSERRSGNAVDDNLHTWTDWRPDKGTEPDCNGHAPVVKADCVVNGKPFDASHDRTVACLTTHVLASKRGSMVSLDAVGIPNPALTGVTLYDCLLLLSQKIGASEKLGENAIDSSILEEEEFVEVLRHLIHFPAVVKLSHKTMESSGLVAYLLTLAQELNDLMAGYNTGPGEDHQLMSFLTAARQVLCNGMALLGLRVAL